MSRPSVRSSILLATVVAALAITAPADAEPAVMSTFSDGNLAVMLPTPTSTPATPTQVVATGLPVDALPHGAAYRTQDEAIFADFGTPRLLRVRTSTGTLVGTVPLPGRTSGNGTIAVSPDGTTALSIGERNQAGQPATAEAVVIRGLASGNLTVTPLAPALRVRRFATAAIDFDASGRAFVCHVDGISLIEPPYASVTRTMTLPEATGTSVCRITRDGQRLFLTRGDGPLYVVDQPAGASPVTTAIPRPSGAGVMASIAISPSGDAVLVGQIFRATTGIDARLFLARAPFVATSTMQEIALPAGLTGNTCGTGTQSCPGFEDLAVNAAGTLAIATGNSSSVDAGFVGRVRAAFVVDPFDDATRVVHAVTLGDVGAGTHGRGTGSVRFQPADLAPFGDSFE